MCGVHFVGINNFYPRPPRGGRPGGMPNPRAVKEISIHALREEGDDTFLFFYSERRKISIHALREEGDISVGATNDRVKIFLSTPSARRATIGLAHNLHLLKISIHALREEGDSLFCKP